MSDPLRVRVPLINPNENEAKLIDLAAKEGQQVAAGDLLATLETTKSTFELTAEQGGYVAGLDAKEGDMLRAGDTFCFLSEDKDWKAPQESAAHSDQAAVPDGLRITQPALFLAQAEGLDLETLPVGPITTEEQVRKALSKASPVAAIELPSAAKDENAIIVYGGGGHGKAVIELIQAIGMHQLIGVIDDGLNPGDEVLGIAVLGSAEQTLNALYQAGTRQAANAVGGIGAISSRIRVSEKLVAAKFKLPNLIHPQALVEPSAKLGTGLQALPHSYIGSQVQLGTGVIVNTSAVISHDCVLEDHVNLAPGSILAGGVHVGEGTLIGMGVTVNLNVRIGSRARIGNGATIKDDVPAGGIVRAGATWPE